MSEQVTALAACTVLSAELRRALERLGRSELELVSFPAVCHLPRRAAAQPISSIVRALGRSNRVVGLCCSRSCMPTLLPEHRGRLEVLSAEVHGEILMGRDATHRAISEGALVILPGWLDRWRQVVVEDWGFDQATARDFYAETNRSLLVLDTGTGRLDHDKLKAFSEFAGLPASVRYVGTSHLEALLARELDRVEHKGERVRLVQEVARAQGSAAEQAAIVDFITELGELLEEDAVVGRVLQLVELLFAPGQLTWTAAPEASQAEPGAAARTSTAQAVGDDSLVVVVRFAGQDLGTLQVGAVAVPSAVPRYLPMACSIADAGAMAVHAARLMRAEKALRIELAAKVEELDSFVSVVAHDLKQPLTVALGLTELLGMGSHPPLAPVALGYVAELGRAIDRMGELIDDLLHLARLGNQVLPQEDVQLRVLLEEIKQDLGTQASRVHVAPLPAIHATRRWVREALLNLVANGLKYNAHSEPRVHVWRAGEERDPAGREMVVVGIRDNGVGIAGADQARIWEIFCRLPGSLETAGTGLGLAIVKKAIEGEGGRVWLESEPGKGTSFFVTLPLA